MSNDIIMCPIIDIDGQENRCPLRDACLRFRKEPNREKQPYFIHPPYNQKENNCNEYILFEED